MLPIVETMSIHTVEIGLYTNKESFNYIRDTVRNKYKLYLKSKIEDYPYSGCFKEEYKSTKNNYIEGVNTIIIRRYKIKKDSPMFSYISIVFNLNTILRGNKSLDPYLTIIHPSQIPESMSRVWDFIDELNIYKREVKIKRIDFSINLKFMSYDEARLFIYLCQKAQWRHQFKDHTHYNKVSHRREKYKDSISKRCNSYEISIYSKHMQMKNSNRGYNDNEIQRALNVIRMEIRIDRIIINERLKFYNCNEEELLMEHYQDIVRDYGKKLIVSMRYALGSGDFYSYSSALDQIDKLRDVTKYKKLQFKEMLKETSDHRSFSWLYSEDSPYNQHQIRDLKNTLKEYNISHITIPDKFNVLRMTNPFTNNKDDAEKCIYGWNQYND